MKSLKKTSFAILAAGTLVFGVPQIAFADDGSYNDTVKELVRMNPGSTYNEMNQAVRSQAKIHGKTPQEVANEALAEARAHGLSGNNFVMERSSSSGGGTLKLKKATARGDIFYSPSSTGHVGIYYQPNTIVEAPGLGQKSQSKTATSKDVNKNTEIMHVRTTQANRNKAANRAWSYRGREYNAKGFAFNRTANGKMNCSQLVWAAYKTTVGIDIDFDEGFGVYPRDIRDSGYTYTYSYVR